MRGRGRAGGGRGVPRRARGVAVLPHRRQRRSCRCSRRRTSSGSATATPDPTPAAWAPTRRCPGRRRAWSTRWSRRSRSRPSTRWRAAARRSPDLLYVGLALTSAGPRVVEFNARFGDPETQVVLPLLATPLAGLLHACGDRHARRRCRRCSGATSAAVIVVVAARWLPRAPRTRRCHHRHRRGRRGRRASTCCMPGTAVDDAGRLVTAGGRVLGVTRRRGRPRDARDRAYEAVDRIRIDGAHHRRDIAARCGRRERRVDD